MSDAALNNQSVQATMLLPLWGRAKYTGSNRDLLDDTQAEQIINSCGLDFSNVERGFGEFSGICYLVRARGIDNTIRSFIEKHPRATIVNIGSGLDTNFSRVDNGQIHWYNLDLPDAISFRHRYIPDSPRNQSIAKSFMDLSWFDDVRFDPADGILFVSGGVFYYFHEEEIRKVFVAMAKRFPGGELFFDGETTMAMNGSNNMVKKTGNHGAMMYFSVNDAAMFETWSPNIRVISYESCFKRIQPRKHWSFRVRLTIRMFRNSKNMSFIHLGFTE